MQNVGRNPGTTGRLIDRADSEAIRPIKEAGLTLTYRGRFAPTPSGPLHLGSLLTGLASFLDARAAGGVWLVRIDDLDSPRVRPGAADLILRTLESLSLHWDESPSFQSQHTAAYSLALEKIEALGLLYACHCTRRETMGTQTHVDGCCPGRCRDLDLHFQVGESALRVKVPEKPIRFHDRIKGNRETSLKSSSGDFILFRRDKIHAYHLATVVDDHQAGVTHVVRGEDLLDATPQQIYLQQLLGLEIPVYAHTPLMIKPDGRKLSKSEGAPPTDPQQGSRILGFLLGHLGLPLPVSLAGAHPTELLDWAIPRWKPMALQAVSTIVIEENLIPI